MLNFPIKDILDEAQVVNKQEGWVHLFFEFSILQGHPICHFGSRIYFSSLLTRQRGSKR